MADHSHPHTYDEVSHTHEHSHDDVIMTIRTRASPTRAASTPTNIPIKERRTLILAIMTTTITTATRIS